MPDDLRQLSLFGSSPKRAPGRQDLEEEQEAPGPAPQAQGSLFGEYPMPRVAAPAPDRAGASRGEAPKAPSGREAAPPVAEQVEALARLAQEAAQCRRCGLRETCRQVVFGEGNPQATLMLVGEGPGAQEDLEGRPFVGRAGQLLDRMLEAIGIFRSEVYIANVVKCRPPGNRVPTPAEQEACFPYLQQQMELIRPEVVLCLGATAGRRLIRPSFSVTREHGVWYEREGRKVMATFHPAALLRDPSKKRLAWDDLRKVQEAYFGGEA